MAVSDAQLIAWIKSGTAKRRILMEVDVKVGASETTLYLSDKGFITGASESPALTTYTPVISGGVSFTESLSLDGQVSLSAGTIEFNNVNGEIDPWQEYIWQGRGVRLYIGDYGWPRTDFYKIFEGITAKVNCTERDKFTLLLSDKLEKLNTTVSDVKLGGSSSNKDKLRPLLFGECFNISPLLVDLSVHEYQIHNGPINDILEVRDNGVPVPFTPYLSTGKFRLTQQPVGTITCSAQGDKPSAYGNDAVTLIKRLVKDFGLAGQRLVDGDLDLSSLATFAAANTQALGIYITEKANVLEVCNQLASSIGARVTMTCAGLLRLVKLDLPQATSGTTITSADMHEFTLAPTELTKVVAAIKLGYCKNWTPQANLQTGIPAHHVEIFSQDWPLTSTQTDSTVATNYKLFVDPVMTETLLITTAATDTEATRLLTLWKTQRRVMQYEGLGHLILEQIGNPQTIQHSRFGLAAGVRGQIISKTTDWLNVKITVGVLL